MAYLHGVEVVQLTQGPRPITTAASSIVGLIGVSHTANAQELILVQSANDLAQFGDPIPGNTLAIALDAIFKQGGAKCIVVNIFSAVDHYGIVTDESVVMTDGVAKGANPFYTAVVVKDVTATTTYVEGTDYTVEDYVVKIVSGGAITNGDTLKISYQYLNPGNVTTSEIAGTDGPPRTGLKLFEEAYNAFGFTPKILMAPYFSDNKTNADNLIAAAGLYRGVALIDSTAGITPTQALTHRGDGTKAFSTSSKRAILLYPHVKASLDWAGESTIPYSAFFAGVMANTDNTLGYWFSPDNKSVTGLTGVERTITFQYDRTDTEANGLNEAGITTIVSSFGTGYITWGQRNAAFPTVTTPDNFISVQRTADILHESIVRSTAQFIGQPINSAVIDAIRESVNQFIRALIQRGALIQGSRCLFIPANNPPAQIAAGQLVFDLEIMPATSLERLTFQSFIDINLLNNLFA